MQAVNLAKRGQIRRAANKANETQDKANIQAPEVQAQAQVKHLRRQEANYWDPKFVAWDTPELQIITWGTVIKHLKKLKVFKKNYQYQGSEGFSTVRKFTYGIKKIEIRKPPHASRPDVFKILQKTRHDG